MKNKKVAIFSIIIILVLIEIRVWLAPVVAGDEFVNYYNTYKMFNGALPWKEVNIITTPLLYLIGGLFFKIFSTKLIVYKFYNVIINFALFYVIYLTFRNLKISRISSLIYTSILEIPIVSYVIGWGATYNSLAIVFVLIGVNLNLKKENLKFYNLWQGLIMFLVFFTKHNIGLYYVLAQIIIELIIEKRWKKITNLIKQILVLCIGIFAFLIVLYNNNLLESFIDMSIIGISQFTQNVKISKVTLMVTVGTIVLLSILIALKKYDLNAKKEIIILSITGAMILLLAYPIADSWHLILASLVLFIELIYVLDFDGIKLKNNKILIGIDCYLILFVLLVVLYTAVNLNNGTFKFETNSENAFYLCFIKNITRIENIEDFIESVDGQVIIVSPEAGIYNLDLKLKSHGLLDVPHNGNLGSNQLEKMIEEIDNSEEKYILIHTEKKYLQEIIEFRDYIEENYEKVGEIEDFSIYKR